MSDLGLTAEQRIALTKFSCRGYAVGGTPATRGTNVVAMRGLAAQGLLTLEEYGVGAWRAQLTAHGKRVRAALSVKEKPSAWDR